MVWNEQSKANATTLILQKRRIIHIIKLQPLVKDKKLP